MKRRLSLGSVLRAAPTVLVVAIIVTLVAYAATAAGYPVRKLELHDTGIWVSNDSDGAYGRLNKAAESLDARVTPPGERMPSYELDVVQEGNLAAGWDQTSGKLTPINTATRMNATDQSVALGPGTRVEMRGSTVAVMDRAGRIWAGRYDPTGSLLDLTQVDQAQKPLAELGLGDDAAPDAVSFSVAMDGSVHAAAVSGKTITIPVEGGRLGKPVLGQVPAPLATVQVTSAGSSVVVLDAESGTAFLDGGRTVRLDPDRAARLQQAGPQARGVLIATSRALLRVDLQSGAVTEVDGGGDGAPAAPVRLKQCDFAAWAGRGHVIRACDDRQVESQMVDLKPQLVRPTFRVNHGLLLLNDQADGRVYDIDTMTSVDNWPDLQPQTRDQQSQNKKEVDREDAKPKAVDDELKARAERTAILHVLDNDTDTAGGVLSIKKVTASGVPAGVTVDVSPDGQTLKFYLPDGVNQASFKYTVSNGRVEDEGEVTVTNAGSSNTPPEVRAGAEPIPYTTASFGNLSLPVVSEWRDKEGDPVTLLGARDDAGDVVPVSADGRIEFTAGKEASEVDKLITYEVTDGVEAKPVRGTVAVHVLGRSSSSKPAIAQPDVARGEVGQPIAIAPLANDIPGADPRDPQARMTLTADVPSKANIKVTTDAKSGQVVAVPEKEGPYFLEYQVGFGSAAFARGAIRVDALPEGSGAEPVAMPDQAAMRGQAAVMVDVLANDYDPAGALLTVQSAKPVDSSQLQAAVIAGRWLRIIPREDSITPNPQAVHYTVSNGSQTASGDVVVTQLDPVDEDAVLVRSDVAVVRDGDSVLVPVLANDTSLSGAPLRLETNKADTDSPGRLPITDQAKSGVEDQGDVGTAFVHGDQVRYIAPAVVQASRQVVITYYALTATGDTGKGEITVTIKPQPSPDAENRTPSPQTVEMRIVSGSRVAVPIPTSGQDPDGDSVTVVGVTSAPKLGRVVGFSPSSLTYEAFPTPGLVGTDTFKYLVTDRYGKTGVGTVRVAVVAPGQTQPPVALDDPITARPGASLQVNVMGNDLVARDDSAVVSRLERLNRPMPQDVRLDGGLITAKSPGLEDQPVLVAYALEGNGGTGPSATLTITSKDGYNNPPVISDQTAIAEGSIAKADLLTRAWDIEGGLADLRVEVLTAVEGLTLTGSQLTVPMLDHPQLIPFVVTDGEGASNGAIVFVPATGVGAPRVKSGALIEIPKNDAASFSITDFVESPEGKPVKISAARIATAPGGLDGDVEGPDTFSLASADDYVGPASVTLEVMDAESQTVEGVHKAMVTIPVQVGPKTPVLRCPSEPQTVMQGGEAKKLDITSLCHVWSPDAQALGTLTYSAGWIKGITGVTAEGAGRAVTLQAAGTAQEKASGTVEVGIIGTEAKAELTVVVEPAPRPTMQAVTVNGIKAGTPVTVPIVVKSELLDAQPAVVKATKLSGRNAQVDPPNGASLVITPAIDAWGPIVYQVTATDLASDPARESRWVTRKVTLVVYKEPDPPGAPKPGPNVQSHAVTLTWKAGNSNGAPIDSYELLGSNGKTYPCRSTKCTVTGLPNGEPITFRVRAHNKGGWSEPGPTSQQIIPDTAPSAPPWVKATSPGDHTLTLTWGMPKNDGSPIKRFVIRWEGGSTSAGASATSATIKGLDNNQVYTFGVSAENNYDVGPETTGEGQSSGKPLGLSVKAPDPKSSVGATTQVGISWSLDSANGPTPVDYSVARSDGKKICTTTSTSCTDDTVTFDGTAYTYSVTATNNTGGADHSASATSPVWKAIGTPGDWGSWSAAPTGANGSAHLSYTVPPSRGGSSTLTLLNNGSTFKPLPSTGPDGGADTRDITGLNNGTTYSFSLRVCNESDKCTVSSQKNVTPFGPLSSPNISASISGNTASFSVSADGNGAPATLVVTATKTGQTLLNETFSGGFSRGGSIDIGYSSSTAFTATLTSGSTNPSRSNPGSVTSNTVTSPNPPNPTIAVSRGTAINTSSCTSSRCHYVVVTLADFSGTQTCRITDSDQGTGGFLAWSQGNGTVQTPNYFGGYWLVIQCGSVSSRFNW